jgi:hypothetical protein
MFTLPILPDEIVVPLGPFTVPGAEGPVDICNYPGVVAYVAPFDVEEASRLNDLKASEPNNTALHATRTVLRLVKRIEGLGMQDPETKETIPFDINNPKHKRSIPYDIRNAIYIKLRERAELAAVTEKNSASPSVSGGMMTGASSVAEAAVKEPATI